jgi:hypothetical protein
MKKTRFILLIAVLLIAMAGLAACQNSGKKVSVIFEMNYENPQETIPSQSIEKGGQAIEPTPPERDGFDFTGWFRDKDSQVLSVFRSASRRQQSLCGRRQSIIILRAARRVLCKIPSYNLQN